MKNNITEIVCILDRSGSMAGLESDVIGGFATTLNDQKSKEGKAYISTVLFNNHSTVIHDRLPLEEVEPMTRDDYRAFGSTALYDAIGDAIKHIANIHKYLRPEDVPEKTIFVITTDGMENASHRYSAKMLRDLIKKKEAEGWEFLFLAANIDADAAASAIGIDEDHVAEYVADCGGIQACYSMMCESIGAVRRRERVNTEKWRKPKKDD